MMSALSIFIRALIGGMAVGVGGTVYLAQQNSTIGAFLFSIGLFMIYVFDLNLFTGKICYIPNRPFSFLNEVLLVYAGNFAGTAIMGLSLRLTKLSNLMPKAAAIADIKMAESIPGVLILATLCGLLMCVAVLGYRKLEKESARFFAIVLPVMVFILAGFEHSIANLFYFSFAGVWSGKAVLYSVLFALGNIFGAVILPLMDKYLGYARLGKK